MTRQDLRVGFGDMLANLPTEATGEPELRLDGLVHPDELFPPIPDKELADGRTREGRAQREYLRRREAYIAAYQQAVAAATLREELDRLTTYYQDRERRNGETCLKMEQFIFNSPWITLVTVQLALLLQARPQTLDTNLYGYDPGYHRVNYALGDVQVSLSPTVQEARITIPGLNPVTIQFDARGNFTPDELSRLCGFFALVGRPIDRKLIELVLSDGYKGEILRRPRSVSSLIEALGRVGVTGVTVVDYTRF